MLNFPAVGTDTCKAFVSLHFCRTYRHIVCIALFIFAFRSLKQCNTARNFLYVCSVSVYFVSVSVYVRVSVFCVCCVVCVSE
jgi:hypothetical protein